MRRLGVSSIILLGLTLAIVRERGGRGQAEVAGPEVDVATPIARAPAESAAKPSEATAAPAPPPPPKAFAYPRELESYRVLALKVFPNEDETRTRGTLLHDAKLLRAAGERVSWPSLGDQSFERERDLSLALLLDARRAGDAVAREVLTGVVKDAQIEDARVDRAVREHLAGLKAEVLYEWSSQSPRDTARLAEMLPGPVSRRLWDNVRQRQTSNLAEGAAEKVGEAN